ncbi:VanZ family protein [Chitinophaga sp.]|uniref:VanZ family protein n=1 Tax=Chitinophaga sp. TaxID=1869181 RepID=UPI0039C8A811
MPYSGTRLLINELKYFTLYHKRGSLFVFAIVVIRKQHTNREILTSCISIVAGLILYEIAQIWIPGRVFDFKDIIASLIGGVIAYGIIYGINKQVARTSNRPGNNGEPV